MGDKEPENPIFGDSGFPYFLIIVVILLHLTVMIIIFYYACCRNKKCCVCLINVQNNTIHQDGRREGTRVSITMTTTDSERLVPGSQESVTGERARDSLLGRIRTRLQSDRTNRVETDSAAGSAEGNPPPYTEIADGGGHSNAGAEFSEIDLHLPAYEDIARQLPKWNDEKECFEEEEPPTYEEATVAKSSHI